MINEMLDALQLARRELQEFYTDSQSEALRIVTKVLDKAKKYECHIENVKALEGIITELDWDNYRHEDGDSRQGYYRISEALWLRMEWLKESDEITVEPESESADTLDMVQRFLDAVKVDIKDDDNE